MKKIIFKFALFSTPNQAKKTMSSKEELNELLRDGARFGDLDDVREALSQGADVDSADDGGKTGAISNR